MLLNKYDKAHFIEIYPLYSHKELAEMYGTNIRAIHYYTKQLGIYERAPVNPSKWTGDEIEYVRQNMDKFPSWLANKLQKSNVTIWKMKNLIMNEDKK